MLCDVIKQKEYFFREIDFEKYINIIKFLLFHCFEQYITFKKFKNWKPKFDVLFLAKWSAYHPCKWHLKTQIWSCFQEKQIICLIESHNFWDN